MIINFTTPINNASIQVGDAIYVSSIESLNDVPSIFTSNSVNAHGTVLSIGPSWIESSGPDPIDHGSFITVPKNNLANTSGLKGYYAAVELTNNSTNPAELFAISSNTTLSSK